MTKAFRWTKYRQNIRTLLQDGEHTVESLIAWMESLRKKAASEQGWRHSELAMTISSDRREIIEVAKRLSLDTSGVER